MRNMRNMDFCIFCIFLCIFFAYLHCMFLNILYRKDHTSIFVHIFLHLFRHFYLCKMHIHTHIFARFLTYMRTYLHICFAYANVCMSSIRKSMFLHICAYLSCIFWHVSVYKFTKCIFKHIYAYFMCNVLLINALGRQRGRPPGHLLACRPCLGPCASRPPNPPEGQHWPAARRWQAGHDTSSKVES
jgi:hypothetical protein